MMKIAILIVSFYLLSFAVYSKTPYVNSKNYKATNNIGVIYGTWVIKKTVPGDVVAITEKEAQEFVGKKVVFKPDYAKVVNDSCGKPIYESKLQNASSYIYDNYRTSKKILGDIADTINVIEVTCKGNPIYNSKNSPNFDYDLIVLNEQSVIINFYGFFFYLERNRVLQSLQRLQFIRI